MRLLNSTTLLLVLVGAALAVPAKKRIEKKSISNSLAPKALEPVDQRLDEPAKLSDAALMDIAGETVDRAKKHTTFCVEIHDDKPTSVDCDEIKNRPIPLPAPAPAPVPEPQEPLPPPPPPPPPPAPVPQQQPEDFSMTYQLPCEPEIAPFYVNPPGEIVYAQTGKCAQHAPALVHVPSNNPVYTISSGGASGAPSFSPMYTVPAGGASGAPSFSPVYTVPAGGASGAPSVNPVYTVPAGGASGTPSINVLHLPTGGSLPNTGYGVAPTIHISPSTGAGTNGPSFIPLHTTGGSGVAPAQTPCVIHMIQPSPLHHGGLPLHGHGGLPLHAQGGLPIHAQGEGTQRPGVQCTCRLAPGGTARSADGSQPSNEALAMKFMQDIQRNAQSGGSPSSPMMVQVGPGQQLGQGQPGSPVMMMSSGPMVAGKSKIRPPPNINLDEQIHIKTPVTPQNVMDIIYNYKYPPMQGYPMPGMNVPRSSSSADCLQDSFSSSSQGLPQGLRLSREEAAAFGQEQPKQTTEEKPEEGTASAGDIVEAILSGEADKIEKNSRIARFLMEKNVESNTVLDEK